MDTQTNPEPPEPGKATPKTPQPAPRIDLPALALHVVQRLDALAEIGMEIARVLRDQQAQSPTTQDPSLGFARVARAVRQTSALQIKLAQPTAAPAAASSAAAQARHATAQRRRRARDKDLIRRMVGHAIDIDPIRADREALLADLEDRIEDDEIDALLLTQSPYRLVASICHDLGITPDFTDYPDRELNILITSGEDIDAGTPPATCFENFVQYVESTRAQRPATHHPP